jgi:mono/diheme cytochrome c family protein
VRIYEFVARTAIVRAIKSGSRHRLTYPAAALALLAGNAALAQDVDNGRRISERACTDCHLINVSAGKVGRAVSFAALAAKPGMSADRVACGFFYPLFAMPGLPLNEGDARDVAAFIMSLKK